MYPYNARRASGISAVFFIILFLIVIIGSCWLLLSDKGKFWDILPFISIPSALINLILFIFYFAKRNFAGYIFTIFFVIFLLGIILSSFFGPFKLYQDATDAYGNKQYNIATEKFKTIIDNYPTSKYIKDATRNLAYSYYLENDYPEAVNYFNLSLEKKYISEQNLEVKKILAESYYKIAEDSYAKKQYGLASKNFLDSVNYFKDISKNFPDTNEAFVAKYKIPELLFKAAQSMNYDKQWDNSIKVLEDLEKNYSDSDYFEKSESLLLDIYISKSANLKESNRLRDSILTFSKVYNLDSKTIASAQSRIYSNLNTLLKGIDTKIIIDATDELFLQNKFNGASFLYNYIYTNFPEDRESIKQNLVDCTLQILLSDTNMVLNDIVPSKPVSFFKKEGLSRVSFENKTEFKITVFIKGPGYEIIELEKATKSEIEIPSGTYSVLVRSDNLGIKPFYGELAYEDGARYREIFKSDQESAT
jgi:TolA-binding protein